MAQDRESPTVNEDREGRTANEDRESPTANGASSPDRTTEAGRHRPLADIPGSASLDGLPADLRAVLSLVLTRRRTYAEIAATLHIEERAVRDRAHAALGMLAPRQARELTAAQRELVGERLLGQASPAGERDARATLAASLPAQAWARALATELGPLATEPLPEVPDVQPASTPPATTGPISRRGGMVVLGAIGATIVAVVLFVVVGVGGGSHGGTNASGAAASSGSGITTTTTSTSGGLHLDATLPLTSPNPASKAVGVVDVVSSNGALGFIIAAEHLPATNGFRYAAWLYNPPHAAVLLGVGPTVGSSGTLKAIGVLPANASTYHQIILTEEPSARPTSPGTMVLSGTFKTS